MSIDFTELTNQLLTAFVSYGPPLLALVLFAGALGLPLPGSVFLIASGAFVQQGVFNPYLAIPLALIGAVAGDLTSYGMGRFAGEFVQRRFGETAAWRSAEATLRQRGGLAVFLTRWLITPLAVPVNLITGGSGYSAWAFLGYDLAGEITWVALYGGLGYFFGGSWEYISQLISDLSGLLVGVAIFAGGLVLVVRWWRQPQSTEVEITPEVVTGSLEAG